MILRMSFPSLARFFMAEDNPGDVSLMVEAIEEVGLAADVEVETDGASAVARLLDPSHQLPDLIILNFNLPKIQGSQVLAAIKGCKRLLGVPVVMLTTSSAQADRLLCASADAYFIKSGDWEELVKIVGHLRDLIDAIPTKRPTTEAKLDADAFWDQEPKGEDDAPTVAHFTS